MNENLKYFVGKVCTVTTVAVNFRFKEEQMMDYFMGQINNIDEQGILMTHPTTHCKNFIMLPHVVSISEEQVLYEDVPEHAKIIEEYRQQKPITAPQRVLVPEKPPQLVNPKELAALVKKGREVFKKPLPAASI